MIRLVGSDGLWRPSVPPSETILRLAVARRAILNFKVRQLGLLELFVLFWSHLYRSPETHSAHAAATAKKKKKRDFILFRTVSSPWHQDKPSSKSRLLLFCFLPWHPFRFPPSWHFCPLPTADGPLSGLDWVAGCLVNVDARTEWNKITTRKRHGQRVIATLWSSRFGLSLPIG